MSAVMMLCGHSANATYEGKPCCVICIGITPELTQKATTPAPEPDLTDRLARCSYCKEQEVPSNPDLPFFEYRPGKLFDSYYCGCRGWE